MQNEGNLFRRLRQVLGWKLQSSGLPNHPAIQKRSLQIEPLEARELLSVTPNDFETLRGQYAVLDLSPNLADYNIIEITDLTESNLRSVLDLAGSTTQDDLIVLRTDEVNHTLSLSGAAIAFSIDESLFGSVTILSLGTQPLTLDGGGLSQIFNIADTSISIGGLDFTGGYAMAGMVDGHLVIEFGGAVGLENVQAKLTNVTFYENASLVAGGAFSQVGGTLDMSDVCFRANTAGYYAGAVLLGEVEAVIRNTVFVDNNATVGGAIYQMYGNLTIENTVFDGNTAFVDGEGAGGAIASESFESLVIIDSIFRNNTSGIGGALAVIGDDVLWTDTTMSGQPNPRNGDCSYLNNRSYNFVSKTGMGFSLPDVLRAGYTTNSGSSSSAYHFNDGETIFISGTVFMNNRVEELGGAIYQSGGKSRIAETQFCGNESGISGGALGIDWGSDVRLIDAVFSGNSTGDAQSDAVHKVDWAVVNVELDWLNETFPVFEEVLLNDAYFSAPMRWSVSVVAVDAEAAETPVGATPNPGCFQITRAGETDLSQELTVFFTLGGSATYGVDYTISLISTVGDYFSVTIPAGATFVNMMVDIIDDLTVEPEERIVLTLLDSSGYSIDSTASFGTIRLVDNENNSTYKWTVWVEAVDGVAAETLPNEELNTGKFRIWRENGTGLDQPLTVKFSISSSSTAQRNTDYYLSVDGVLLTSNSVTIPAGQRYVDIDINVIDDGIIELTETVTLTVMLNTTMYDRPTSAALYSATVNILDNDMKWTVWVEAVAGMAAETLPSEEPNPGKFRIWRENGLSLSQSSTVNFTISGTATRNTDYTLSVNGILLTLNSVTIPTWQQYVDIEINVIDDNVVELAETVVLSLSTNRINSLDQYALPGTVSHPSKATVTILDNDVPPTLWIDEAIDVTEGGTGTFLLKRDDTANSLTVSYRITGITATGQEDFTVNGATWSNANGGYYAGSVTFLAGQDTAIITVRGLKDGGVELTETLVVTLDQPLPKAGIMPYILDADRSQAIMKVLDADVAPLVWIERVENADDGDGRFIVKRNDTRNPLTVRYVQSGTAQSAWDYYQLSGTIVFAVGQDTAEVIVRLRRDALIREDTTLIITLDTPFEIQGIPQYVLDEQRSSVPIILTGIYNAPMVWLDSIENGVEGESSGHFILKRDDVQNALTITYTLTGTARNGLDYQSLSGIARFAEGEDTAVIVVIPEQNGLVEGTKTVVLTLRNSIVINGVVQYLLDESRLSGVLEIEEDDVAPNVWVEVISNENGDFFHIHRDVAEHPLVVKYSIQKIGYDGLSTTASSANVYFVAGENTIDVSITATEVKALTFALSPGTVNNVDQYLLPNTEQRPSTARLRFGADEIGNVSVIKAIGSERHADEEQDPVIFRITRMTSDTSRPLSVSFQLGGTAFFGRDYLLSNGDYSIADDYGSITIPAGETYIDLILVIIDNSQVEPTRTVDLTLLDKEGSYSLGVSSQVSGQILDNDGVMTLSPGGPYAVYMGESILLSASKLYDPWETEDWTYFWDLSGDGIFDVHGASVLFSAVDVTGPMQKTVWVKATDSLGHSTVGSVEILILSVALTGTLTGPGTGNIGQNLLWNGSLGVHGKDTWTVSVDYGDGIRENNVPVLADNTFVLNHAYLYKGNYTITVVIDNGTESTLMTHQVRIGTLTPEELLFNGPIPSTPESSHLPDRDVAPAPAITALSYSGFGGGTIVGNAVVVNLDGDDSNPYTFVPLTQPEDGTLVINNDGSFTYEPEDTETQRIEFIVYEIQDSEGHVTNTGIIPIMVLPAATQNYSHTAVPSGYNINPSSDSFGSISVAGQGYQADSLANFLPTLQGNYQSQTAITHNTSREFAGVESNAQTLPGNESLNVTIVMTDWGNGDWVYTELVSYSYSFSNADSSYKGGYTYVLHVSMIGGVYESIFDLFSSDSFRHVRNISEDSANSSMSLTSMVNGSSTNHITIRQQGKDNDAEQCISDTRTSQTYVTEIGVGTYCYAVSEGSVSGSFTQSAQSSLAHSSAIVREKTNSTWSSTGTSLSLLTENNQSRYSGSGTFVHFVETPSSYSLLSGIITENGGEQNSKILTVNGSLGGNGVWSWSGEGRVIGIKDDFSGFSGTGNYHSEGGSPGNTWQQDGTFWSQEMQREHTDYNAALIYSGTSWTVLSGNQNASGNTMQSSGYNASGLYSNSGSSEGYSWSTTGLSNASGNSTDSTWYMLQTQCLGTAWNTAGIAGGSGNESTSSDYTGRGNYAFRSANTSVDGSTSESGHKRSSMNYMTSSVLQSNGLWQTTGMGTIEGQVGDASSFNGRGTFSMPVNDDRITGGDTCYTGTATQNGRSASDSNWNGRMVLQNNSWVLVSGSGSMSESGQNGNSFNGSASTSESWTDSSGATYSTSTQRNVDGSNEDEFRTNLILGVLGGDWRIQSGAGNSRGNSHSGSDFNSSGNYSRNTTSALQSSSLSGTVNAHGTDSSDSNYNFQLFWESGAWKSEGDLFSYGSGSEYYASKGNGTFSMDLSTPDTTNKVTGTIQENHTVNSSYNSFSQSRLRLDGSISLACGFSFGDYTEHSDSTWEGQGTFSTSSQGSGSGSMQYSGDSTYRNVTVSDYNGMQMESVVNHGWMLISGTYNDTATFEHQTTRHGSGTKIMAGNTYDMTGSHEDNSSSRIVFEGILNAAKTWDHSGHSESNGSYSDSYTTTLQEKEYTRSIMGGEVSGTIRQTETEKSEGSSETKSIFDFAKNEWSLQYGRSEASLSFSNSESYQGNGEYAYLDRVDDASLFGNVNESGDSSVTFNDGKIVSTYDKAQKKWVDSQEEGTILWKDKATFSDQGWGLYSRGDLLGIICDRSTSWESSYSDTLDLSDESHKYELSGSSSMSYALIEFGATYEGMTGDYVREDSETENSSVNVSLKVDKEGNVLNSSGTRKGDLTEKYGFSFTLTESTDRYDSYSVDRSREISGNIVESFKVEGNLGEVYSVTSLIGNENYWTITTGSGKSTTKDTTSSSKTATNNKTVLIAGLSSATGTETVTTEMSHDITLTKNAQYEGGQWTISGHGNESNTDSYSYTFTGNTVVTTTGNRTTTKGGNSSNSHSTSSDLTYEWNTATDKWDISGSGTYSADTAFDWSEESRSETNTTITTSSLSHKNEEDLTIEYDYERGVWTISNVSGSGDGEYISETTTTTHTESTASLSYNNIGFPIYGTSTTLYPGTIPYPLSGVGFSPTITQNSSSEVRHEETWNIEYVLIKGKVIRNTDGTVTKEEKTALDFEATYEKDDSDSYSGTSTGTHDMHLMQPFRGEDYVCKSEYEWESSKSFSDSYRSERSHTVTTTWSNKANDNGVMVYTAQATAELNESIDGQFDYQYDYEGTGQADYYGTRGNFQYTALLDRTESSSRAGEYRYENNVKAEATFGVNNGQFVITSREGSEFMSLDTSNETHGYWTGAWFFFFSHNRPTSSLSESSFALDISWEGTTNGYSGGAVRSNPSETEWRINEDRTWNKRDTNGNWVTGQPEEAKSLRYGGGITATLAKEKTPGGLTSGAPTVKGAVTVAKPTFRPGFPAGGQTGSVPVPTEVPQPPDIQTPEPSGSIPVTPESGWLGTLESLAGWAKWGVKLINPIPIAQSIASDVYDNVTTVYSNMRSDKNNSVGFSAYAAVGSLLARYTGVENVSYAWEKTDPVTGEEYSGGQRALYAALGAVELVITATGVLQLGKAAIAPRGCFTAGTQVVVGVEYDENDVFVRYVTTNIEDIKVGDLVYSYDTINGIYEYKEVTETFALKSGHINYLTIEDENGNIQTIETTDVHPFWVVTDNPDLERAARSVVDENGVILYHEDINAALNGFWVEAKDLRIGDVFLGSDGKLSVLTGVTRVEQTGGINVFNFTVDGNSNYFVLEKDFTLGQTCVLVHNAVACGDSVSAWIKHDTYNEVRDSIGKTGANKFVNSMQKGIVAGHTNGIKVLNPALKLGEILYKYEIKIKGNLGDYRLFGYFDSKAKSIIFDIFDRGIH